MLQHKYPGDPRQSTMIPKIIIETFDHCRLEEFHQNSLKVSLKLKNNSNGCMCDTSFYLNFHFSLMALLPLQLYFLLATKAMNNISPFRSAVGLEEGGGDSGILTAGVAN